MNAKWKIALAALGLIIVVVSSVFIASFYHNQIINEKNTQISQLQDKPNVVTSGLTVEDARMAFHTASTSGAL